MLVTAIFSFSLILYQLCGMCPISLNSNKQQRCLEIMFTLWSWLCTAGVVTLFVIALFYVNEIFDDNDSILGSLNNIIKFLTVVGTHIVVLIESWLTKHNQVKIWDKFQIVDKSFTKMDLHTSQNNKNYQKNYVIKFLLCFGFAWFIEITIISAVQDDIQWRNSWSVTIFSVMISRLRHIQETMYIDLLTFRLNVIKKELKQIVHLSNKNDINMKEEIHTKILFNKVKVIKEAYNILWEISVHINKCFGFSQLFNLMYNFIQLTCDLYWVYAMLYQNNFTNFGCMHILCVFPNFHFNC